MLNYDNGVAKIVTNTYYLCPQNEKKISNSIFRHIYIYYTSVKIRKKIAGSCNLSILAKVYKLSFIFI